MALYTVFDPDIEGDFRPSRPGEMFGNSRVSGRKVYKLNAGLFTEIEKWDKTVFPVGTKIDIWVIADRGRYSDDMEGEWYDTTIEQHLGNNGAAVKFHNNNSKETYKNMNDLYFRRSRD